MRGCARMLAIAVGYASDVPDTRRRGLPAKDEMPSTLQRSPKKAQRTWAKAHDSAVETYGEGERAHRTAFSAL